MSKFPLKYHRLNILLHFLDAAPFSVKEVKNEIEERITGFDEDNIFFLARAYMSAKRPEATKLLRRVVEVELFFITTFKLVGLFNKTNSESLESLLFLELKERKHELSSDDFLRVLWFLRWGKNRRGFLRWSTNTIRFSLRDLLSMRQIVLYLLHWKERKGSLIELEIIDEAIKLNILCSSRVEIEETLLELSKEEYSSFEFPDFFEALISKIYRNRNVF